MWMVCLDFADVQCENCGISNLDYTPVDVSAFRTDIAGVADALRRFDDDCPAAAGLLDGFTPSRVVMGGMGSSGFAAADAVRRLRRRGLDAMSERPSSGSPIPPATGTLFVGVSASGRTTETVAALERHLGTSRTLAVTQDSVSPLAVAADQVLLLPSTTRGSGTAVQQFQLVVAALQLLESALAGPGGAEPNTAWRRAADSVDGLVDGARSWIPAVTELFDDRPVFAVADQARLASARQTALLVREVARSLADSSDFGDWAHCDVYLSARPGYAALAFGTSEWAEGFVGWMVTRRCPVVCVGTPLGGLTPAVSIRFDDDDIPAVAALVEVTVGELLAGALAESVAIDDPTRVMRELRS